MPQAVRPFPEHALRSRLLAGCGRGPELFLARRAAFAASLAAACAFGYVGGVGDRHTSNVLLQVGGRRRKCVLCDIWEGQPRQRRGGQAHQQRAGAGEYGCGVWVRGGVWDVRCDVWES